MALGDNIKRYRSERGWTSYQLAERAGTTQATISRIESGSVRPRRKLLEKVAGVLNVPVAQLEYGNSDWDVVPIGKRRIPILDYTQAGQWAGVAPTFRDGEMTDFVLTDAEYSASAFALVVRGDSMSPLLTPGEILTIDPAVSPRPGDLVVAVDKAGEATIKRYAHVGVSPEGKDIIELRPENPYYPAWNSERTPFRIIGTVVEATRRFRSRAST